MEPTTVWVYHRAAGWFTPAVGAALCAGLVAGWLLAGAALHRFRRHGWRRRAVIVVLGVASLALTGGVLLGAANQALVIGLESGWAPNDSLFAAATLAEGGMLVGPATIGLLATGLVIASRPSPPRAPAPPTPAQTWRWRLWGATGLHLAFVVAWCTVGGLFLARLVATGDAAGMTSGAYDPKGLIPFGHHPMNPFMWLYALVALLYLVGGLAGPALLTVSVPLLVAGRRVAAQAGVRTAWRALLATALMAAALPVLTFTLGRDVMIWWLD